MGTGIEGCAGVVSFTQQSRDTGRYYDNAKHLATDEFNYAVEGLIDTGAEDILMIDGHGPGAVWFDDVRQPKFLTVDPQHLDLCATPFSPNMTPVS